MIAMYLSSCTSKLSAWYASASPQHDSIGLSGCISSRYHARTFVSVASHWPLSRAWPKGASKQATEIARHRTAAVIAISFSCPQAGCGHATRRLGTKQQVCQTGAENLFFTDECADLAARRCGFSKPVPS